MKGFDSHAIGRRKSSVARVFVKEGSGVITVNGKDLTEYFGREILQYIVKQPLIATKTTESYDILMTVKGGGKSGQAGACRLGITRAIDKLNEEFHAMMKPLGLFTRDPRVVERKKFGRHKARKKPQFSKR